jgi:hypothetical protein
MENFQKERPKSAHPLALMELSDSYSGINWELVKKIREEKAKLKNQILK